MGIKVKHFRLIVAWILRLQQACIWQTDCLKLREIFSHPLQSRTYSYGAWSEVAPSRRNWGWAASGAQRSTTELVYAPRKRQSGSFILCRPYVIGGEAMRVILVSALDLGLWSGIRFAGHGDC
jgi:hypothetical protein